MRDYNFRLCSPKLFHKSGACPVDGVAKVISVGAGRVNGVAVVDVSQIEIANNDENYTLKVQGSLESDFSSDYTDLASLKLGAKEVIGGDVDSTYGRYRIPFTNEKDGVIYPHLRMYVEVGGTVANGIKLSAWLEKDPAPTTTSVVTATTDTATTTTTA